MGHVYGDSTAFPYDVNFIEQIRLTVECGVSLMAAQHEMRGAHERTASVESARTAERGRMNALADSLKLSMTAFMSSHSERVARAAARVLEAARGIVDAELHGLDGHVLDTQSHESHARVRAQEAVYRAIEAFTLNQDLPNTEVSLRLFAGEEAYAGQVIVSTPFDVEAVFALAIPSAHAWGKPRRVLELSASTEIHLPAETGIFSKKLTMQPVKLDKFFVSEVARGPERALVTLRRGPRSGMGYELEVLLAERRVLLRRVADDGHTEEGAEVIELFGEDLVHAERLWGRIAETTHDLAERRQAMTAATFDGKNLRELLDPQAILLKLMNCVAPLVREIARRSGAPGELVLRRDLGGGRREEIYITKAELHEKVMALPPTCRPIFDPLDLSEGPRSPRAHAASEQIFIDAETTNPGIDTELTRLKGR